MFYGQQLNIWGYRDTNDSDKWWLDDDRMWCRGLRYSNLNVGLYKPNELGIYPPEPSESLVMLLTLW